VGFLGGFTTFATFSGDVFFDLEAGRGAEALAYFAASTVLGLLAVALGYLGTRSITH
jgi:CrcB protein